MGLPKGQTNSGCFKKGEHRSKSTEFKKGKRNSEKTEFGNKPPWNKGLKGNEYKNHYKKGFGGLIKKGSEPWNKGKYKPNKELRLILRDCYKMHAWRNVCFERDNWTCKNCGSYGGKLVVHHIIHFETLFVHYNIQSIYDGLFCNQLWDEDNGISLCKECHKKRHKEEGYRR